jgi:hypothetical protein
MEAINLSEAAEPLLHLHLDGSMLEVGARYSESLPGHIVERTGRCTGTYGHTVPAA